MFIQKHWIDRATGYGVAAHEGALFGLANQILGTLTAVFLVILSVSGPIMWWRRRPVGLLGAPVPTSRARFGPGLVAAIVALALYLPMFALTLATVLVVSVRCSAASRQPALARVVREPSGTFHIPKLSIRPEANPLHVA